MLVGDEQWSCETQCKCIISIVKGCRAYHRGAVEAEYVGGLHGGAVALGSIHSQVGLQMQSCNVRVAFDCRHVKVAFCWVIAASVGTVGAFAESAETRYVCWTQSKQAWC